MGWVTIRDPKTGQEVHLGDEQAPVMKKGEGDDNGVFDGIRAAAQRRKEARARGLLD